MLGYPDLRLVSGRSGPGGVFRALRRSRGRAVRGLFAETSPQARRAGVRQKAACAKQLPQGEPGRGGGGGGGGGGSLVDARRPGRSQRGARKRRLS
eukprot:713850-Pyramimonas_sp.AAC.2